MLNDAIGKYQLGEGVIIEEGYSDCRILNINGNKVVLKMMQSLPTPIKRGLRKLEGDISQLLLEKTPKIRSRSKSNNSLNCIKKEVLTLNLWQEFGIRTPRVLDFEGSSIVYEFIEKSSSISTLLNKKFERAVFEKTCNLYQIIRKEALRREDYNFFHSDPNLGNFLYDYEHEEILPIDPGIIPNNTIAIETLDSLLSIFMFSEILHLDRSKEEQIKYIETFADTFSHSEKEEIIALLPSPFIVQIYFTLREELAYRIRNRPKIPFQFPRQDQLLIKEILSTR